jgi:hypothetical protein
LLTRLTELEFLPFSLAIGQMGKKSTSLCFSRFGPYAAELDHIAGQNEQNLNNTFCLVSRDRELLAAFLKESWKLYNKTTVFFPRFEQLGNAL